MKLAVPIIEDLGKDSPVCDHFGGAPLFLLMDTDTGTLEVIRNENAGHAHGMCQPLQALAGKPFDAIAVRGIGAGAIAKLRAAGKTVYMVDARTAAEVLEAAKAGSLQEVAPGQACGGHGHGCGR